MIYLDHAATTPLLPEVRDAVMAALDGEFGNPSSLHAAGRAARRSVEESRRILAEALGARPGDIVFTASGTEANNMALRGFAAAQPPAMKIHLVVSAIEHPCLHGAALDLEQRCANIEITWVSPGSDGVVSAEAVADAIRLETRLVSVMAVNNETGAVAPIEAISAICRERGIFFHTDACQALGRIDGARLGAAADLLTVCAHKVYGPKGAAALVVRDAVPMRALLLGGHQERERRAGTENVAAIAGFAAAVRLAAERLDEWRDHARSCERALLAALDAEGLAARALVAEEHRAPGILNLAVDGLTAEELVIGLDLEGIAISNGSACNSGAIEPSRVLGAMGLDRETADAHARFSAGLATDPADMARVAAAVAELHLRKHAA